MKLRCKESVTRIIYVQNAVAVEEDTFVHQ
jgi:hypothetical protein